MCPCATPLLIGTYFPEGNLVGSIRTHVKKSSWEQARLQLQVVATHRLLWMPSTRSTIPFFASCARRRGAITALPDTSLYHPAIALTRRKGRDSDKLTERTAPCLRTYRINSNKQQATKLLAFYLTADTGVFDKTYTRRPRYYYHQQYQPR